MVPPRQGPHRVEGGKADARHGGLGAAGNHDLGVTAADHLGCLAERVAGRRARAGHGEVGAFGARLDRDHASQHVRQHHRHDERSDAIGPARVQRDCRVDDGADAADAAADEYPDVLGFVRSDAQPSIPHGFLGRHQPKLEEAIHAPRLFAVEVVRRVEVLDFAADPDVEVVRLEALNWRDARAAVNDCLPGGCHVQADRRQRAHACDHNATLRHPASRQYNAGFLVSFAADLALGHGEC